MGKESDSKVFYGWVVCGVCTLLLFITMGTASNGLSVFMPYIMKDFGLTNAQTSSLVTLRCTFAFVSMLLIGHYYDRVGYRLGTSLAALCCCAAYVIYSFAGTYLQFCVGASVAGISYGLGSMIPVAILMNRWFVSHRSLAIGICSAGSSLAIIVLPPVLTGIILRFSLRTAFLFTAGYVLLSSVLIFALIREKPLDKGLEPLGGDRASVLAAYRARREAGEGANAGTGESDSADGSAVSGARQSLSESAADTLSLRGWILMGIVCVTMGALANPGFMHLTVLYTSEGFGPMTVALVISVAGIVMTAFKVVCGETADRLGGFRSSSLFFGIFFLSNLLCCLAFLRSIPLALVAAVLFGMGCPISTVGIPIWAGDLVSQEHYADVLRRLQLIYAAGAMLFATMPGIIADHLGSYVPVYGLFALMLAGAFCCLIAAYRKGR